MKHLKKLLVVVAAVVLAMAMTATAFAQNVNGDTTDEGKGQITISNASKGETYTAYLLFEATLGNNNEVAYKGTIPDSLKNFFEETSEGSGYVQAKPAAYKSVTYYTDATKTTVSEEPTGFWTGGDDMSDALKAALKTWAEGQEENAGTAVSNGSSLVFNNLTYGYYVVTTSQGEQLISVDTTTPSATIIDKNTTEPTAVKTVDKTSYTIGDTITYTASFNTTNWLDETVKDETTQKETTTNYQVKSYTIDDTLPAFLSDIQITSVKVIETAAVEDDPDTPEDEAVEEVSTDLSGQYTVFNNKQIVISWVDANGNSLYKNGSQIVITYTAKLTDTVNVDGSNINTVTITPNKDTEGDQPWNRNWKDDANVTTYAAALKKTDGTNALKGAEFTIAGLTAKETESGVYTVQSYSANPAEGFTPTTLKTDDNGMLYIIGLASDVQLTVTETKAPDGYNKLTTTETLTPQVLNKTIYKTSGYEKYDAKGNLIEHSETTSEDFVEVVKNLNELDPAALVIVNKSGAELPSTGGIGTTILYIVGGIMVLLAVVFLITKKRVANKKSDHEMI